MENTNKNLLPYDGIVEQYGVLFPPEVSKKYFEKLTSTVSWKQDQVIMFSKSMTLKRKTAWYGDKPFKYTYSQITHTALPWTAELRKIKTIIENISKETYNSCLLNLYHSGDEGMGWHSDDEKEIKPNSAIASVSFGAGRRFHFKHKKTNERVDCFLDPGSLLLMKDTVQQHWLHQLPKTKKVKEPRINLTFRTML